MSSHSVAESLLGTLHKVATATTVSVDLDTTGNYIRALCVEDLGAHNFEIGVRNLDDLAIANEHRAIFLPTRRGQNITIDYSCKHS